MKFTELKLAHLQPKLDSADAAELFKQSIRMVEIEVFSYCNRRCWFCPNATIDRISSNEFMSAAMYTSIIAQLASIDYTGMVTYSRYNEPLADKIILDRIAEAHSLLPRALLHTNTNGDYLDRDYIAQLYDAGLRSLNIQIYLQNNERYDDAKIKQRGAQTLRRVGLPSTLVADRPGEWYEHRLEYRDMAIRMYGRNFEYDGTSRGDQVPIHRTYRRTAPCLMPFWAVYIDHDGSLVPCCNFRSDLPAHADYVIGTLASQPDLFQHYGSVFASSFRKSLLHGGIKGGLCHNCNYALETPTAADQHIMDQLQLAAGQAGL